MSKSLKLSPWPYYEEDEIEAALETLRSGRVNYWTGELGKKFESAYAVSVGRKYGIALSNGTVGLELALRALGIADGDEVIVPSRSYVASATCVLLVGATPVFADIDIESGNICVETIEPLINERTKAIIPVHIAGWPCNMPAIMQLASHYGIKVIEDCAQAHGAVIGGKQVGAWGDAAVFSFCQDKIISTGGEGGMLLIDDEYTYKKAWAYKDIGRSYDAVYNKNHSEGFRWLTETAGSNFRMTEFQAAIGLKQLEKLSSWIKTRNHIARSYIEVLNNYDYIQKSSYIFSDNYINSYYRVYFKVKYNHLAFGLTNLELRNKIVTSLNNVGIPCLYGACAEIYREKAFERLNHISFDRLNNAAIFTDNAFCFLTHHTIQKAEIENILINVRKVLDKLD